ncbi:MAG: hypothetical protein Q9162_001599 [Coniocarpon cinnabarinum]
MARKTAEQKRKQQAQNAAAAKIPGTAQYCAHKEHKAQKAASKHAASAPLPSEAGPSTFATATNSASGPASTLSSPSSQSPWASSNSSIQSSDAATVSTGSSAEAASLPTPPPSTPSPVRRPRTIWIPDVLDDHPEYGRLSPQYVDNFAHNAGAIREMVAPAPQEKTSRKGFAKVRHYSDVDVARSTELTYWYVRCSWAGYAPVASELASASTRTMRDALAECVRYAGCPES